MSLIEWNNAMYSVNNEEFDGHHKQLLYCINNLHEAMMNGKGKQALSHILEELREYTYYHFAAEEQQMLKVNYPDFAQHKKEHDNLIDQLKSLMMDYEAGKREVSIETFRFLKEWLFNHIQVCDKKYVPYLKV